MHCNQLQLPLQQQQQRRESVRQENATLVTNQCVVTMQLNVNQIKVLCEQTRELNK